MASIITVASMLERIRDEADIENDPFFTDGALVTRIAQAYKYLYNLLVSRFEGQYFNESAQIVTTTNVDEYDLPDDFYKLVGVDELRGNNPRDAMTLRPRDWNSRNRLNSAVLRTQFSAYRYLLRAGKIRFLPVPDGATTFTLWYVPAPPVLTESDSFDGIAGFEDYIVQDVCCYVRKKQDLDDSLFQRDKAVAEKMVLDMAAERDAGFPQTVTDVNALDLEHPLSDFFY